MWSSKEQGFGEEEVPRTESFVEVVVGSTGLVFGAEGHYRGGLGRGQDPVRVVPDGLGDLTGWNEKTQGHRETRSRSSVPS